MSAVSDRDNEDCICESMTSDTNIWVLCYHFDAGEFLSNFCSSLNRLDCSIRTISVSSRIC